MDKKAKRIDRIQNLVIILLSISALVLFWQTPLFERFSDSDAVQSILRFVRGTSGTQGSFSVQQNDSPYSPVFLVRTNAPSSGGSVLSGDPVFESAASFLREALLSGAAPSPVEEADFLSCLTGQGLYMDFGAAIPLDLLCAWLGISTPSGYPADVRRCFLSLADTGSVVLYLQNGSAHCSRSATKVSSRYLAEYCLSRAEGDVFFAALSQETSSLSPYTLLPADPGARSRLIAAGGLTEQDISDLLSAAGFNPHTHDRYLESSGTVVVLEGQRSLRVYPNGTVVYSGDGAQPGSPYLVSAKTRASLTEAVIGAQSLLFSLTRDTRGDAAWYLSGTAVSDEEIKLFFDRAVDGISIRFADGSHGAEITVTDNSITSFSLHLRRYTKSESASVLLPTALACAIGKEYPDAILSIAYIDSYGETVSAGWIANPPLTSDSN